ncbi:hypothetical protein BJ878DRAFT_571633 [Calycina marina]|uniref:Uncharacterized protein n=1 Tax=Calycina marina TaxID=1763456 RepID=A0A9P7ZC48_9HELO|nr:hypothetical protein BJ878DRAFT_571633 [Calycina marina]
MLYRSFLPCVVGGKVVEVFELSRTSRTHCNGEQLLYSPAPDKVMLHDLLTLECNSAGQGLPFRAFNTSSGSEGLLPIRTFATEREKIPGYIRSQDSLWLDNLQKRVEQDSNQYQRHIDELTEANNEVLVASQALRKLKPNEDQRSHNLLMAIWSQKVLGKRARPEAGDRAGLGVQQVVSLLSDEDNTEPTPRAEAQVQNAQQPRTETQRANRSYTHQRAAARGMAHITSGELIDALIASDKYNIRTGYQCLWQNTNINS